MLNDVLVMSTVKKHVLVSLRDLADRRDVIEDSLRDVIVGVVAVAIATCALLLTTQLIEVVLLRLVTSWKRCRHYDHRVSRRHQQCSDDWRSTYSQFDDVTDMCVPPPPQQSVIMFDLSSGFAETNV